MIARFVVTLRYTLFTLERLRVGLKRASHIIKNTLKFACLELEERFSQLEMTLISPTASLQTFCIGLGCTVYRRVQANHAELQKSS